MAAARLDNDVFPAIIHFGKVIGNVALLVPRMLMASLLTIYVLAPGGRWIRASTLYCSGPKIKSARRVETLSVAVSISSFVHASEG